MKQGDIVIYVCEFDSDESYSPNTAPAVVVKVHKDDKLDIVCFVDDGSFHKRDVSKAQSAEDREVWRLKD